MKLTTVKMFLISLLSSSLAIQTAWANGEASTISIAIVTQEAEPSMAADPETNWFSSNPEIDSYELTFYELGSGNKPNAENTLSAQKILEIKDGENIEEHAYSLKLSGYKFVKHFKVDEDILHLLAVVYFKDPQCMLWSELRPIESSGQEYNFYLMANARQIMLRSEADVSAPGEPTKISNRFTGNCGPQKNAKSSVIKNAAIKSVSLKKPKQNNANYIAQSKPKTTIHIAKPIKQTPVVFKESPKNAVIKEYVSVIPNTVATVKPKNKQNKIVEVTHSSNEQVKFDNRFNDNQLNREASYTDKSNNPIYLMTGIGRVSESVKSLIIREAPGRKSKRVSSLYKRTSVQVLRYTPAYNGWVYIESEGGIAGWAADLYVNWQSLSSDSTVKPIAATENVNINKQNDYKKINKKSISTTDTQVNKKVSFLAKSNAEQIKNTKLNNKFSPTQLNQLASYTDTNSNKIYFITGFGQIHNVASSAKLRNSPGENNLLISFIPRGKSVQVLRYTPALDGWIYIEREGGIAGWVTEQSVKWQLL